MYCLTFQQLLSFSENTLVAVETRQCVFSVKVKNKLQESDVILLTKCYFVHFVNAKFTITKIIFHKIKI